MNCCLSERCSKWSDGMNDGNFRIPVNHLATVSLSALISVCLLFLAGLPAQAWVFCPEKSLFAESPDRGSGTVVVLDPDQWSRREILDMRSRGLVPIARLDIAHRERRRTFASLIDEKWLVIPKHSPAPDPAPVRFYLDAWQRLLLTRVDQLLHLGFSGLLLEGTSAATEITDHPTIGREMQTWAGTITRHVRSLGIGSGTIFLRHEGGTIPEPDCCDSPDGIVVSWLWYPPRGRNLHPWERAVPLKRLSSWISRGRRVLTLDHPRTLQDRRRVAEEARAAGFDPGFAIPQGEPR